MASQKNSTDPFFHNINAVVLTLTSTEISRNKTKYLSAVINIYCLKYPNIQNVYLYFYNLFIHTALVFKPANLQNNYNVI